MSELLVNTIKKADGTGSLTVPAESGTVVVKDGSNDVTLNNITATGVYLGGTGAANYLDDYEEGTFTPVVQGSTTTGTGTYTIQHGTYTKSGRLVHFTLYLTWTAHTGTGGLRLGGLPFTCLTNANEFPVISTYANNISVPSGHYVQPSVVLQNTTYMDTKDGDASSTVVNAANIPMDTSGTFLVAGTYQTN